MARKKIFYILFVFLFGIIALAKSRNQNSVLKSKKSLTEILQMISKKKKVFVNFNPEVTNFIYIKDVSADKNIVESLNCLLVDYDLEIKKAGLNFLYVAHIQKIVIKGCVKEKKINKRLSNITVFIDRKSSVRTNVSGNFSFLVRRGKHKLTIRDKSYYPTTLSLSQTTSVDVLIELKKKELKVSCQVIPDIQKEKRKVQVPFINGPVTDSLLALRPYIPITLPDSYRSNLMSNLPLPNNSHNYALKSNLIMWGLASPNIVIEKKFSENITAEISLGLKVGKTKHDGKSISYLIQPEIRYWFFRSFNGAFIGFHMYYVQFNGSNIVFPFQTRGSSNFNNYKGYLYGMGASCGYQWLINKHWHIETTVGASYIHLVYNKKRLDYNLDLTKAAINLGYAF